MGWMSKIRVTVLPGYKSGGNARVPLDEKTIRLLVKGAMEFVPMYKDEDKVRTWLGDAMSKIHKDQNFKVFTSLVDLQPKTKRPPKKFKQTKQERRRKGFLVSHRTAEKSHRER